jgi:putative SOS response-associated peptidase YedK
MCGRYASTKSPADLVLEFDIDRVSSLVEERPLPPDYNVAPTKDVYAVLARADREEPDVVTRRLTEVRWGLVPSWAKDVSIGNRMINARLETAASKPSFRKAWAARRCILPADGYYEWYQPVGDETAPHPDGTGPTGRKPKKPKKPAKIPFYVRARDGGSLAMAGLYELWRDDAKADDDPARWLWSVTVLTTDAADDVGRIHERMPLLVRREAIGAWLDPNRAPAPDWASADGDGPLQPAVPGLLEAYPVSTLVNNVANNSAELIEPAADEPTLDDLPGTGGPARS